jgi:hypothetical protein
MRTIMPKFPFKRPLANRPSNAIGYDSAIPNKIIANALPTIPPNKVGRLHNHLLIQSVNSESPNKRELTNRPILLDIHDHPLADIN